MNLHLSGHHLEVTDSMRNYITGKLDRVKRHFDHVIDVNMILSVDKLVQKVEANVHLSGKNIFVESQDDDMYAAIDSLIDKLDRQIIKHKEKHGNRRGNAARQAESEQPKIHDEHGPADHRQRHEMDRLDEGEEPDGIADDLPDPHVLERLEIRKQHWPPYCGRQPASQRAAAPSCGESQSYQL